MKSEITLNFIEMLLPQSPISHRLVSDNELYRKHAEYLKQLLIYFSFQGKRASCEKFHLHTSIN